MVSEFTGRECSMLTKCRAFDWARKVYRVVHARPRGRADLYEAMVMLGLLSYFSERLMLEVDNSALSTVLETKFTAICRNSVKIPFKV